MMTVRTTEFGSTTTDLGQFARPGLPAALTVVPQYKSDKPEDIQKRLADTSPRWFSMRGRLSETFSGAKNVIVAFDKESGGSYFRVTKDTAVWKIASMDGFTCEAEFNTLSQLAAISMRCLAQSIDQARATFFRTIRPFLDYLCFLADVPYHINQVSIVDELHHLQTVEVVHAEVPKLIQIGAVAYDMRLAPYLAMYREAKNSSSVIYKFLCYYKVLEGVFKRLQPDVMKSLKEAGIMRAAPRHIVPNPGEFDDYSDEQKTFIGKSIQQFMESHLTAKYRNAVAHFSLDDGTTLNVSDFSTIDKYANVLPILENCCRTTISNLQTFLNPVGTEP